MHKLDSRAIHMGRIIPELDQNLRSDIEENRVKPKEIGTRRKSGLISLPVKLEMAAQTKLKSFGNKQFRQEILELLKIISTMKLPDDPHTTKLKKADIRAELQIRQKLGFIPFQSDDNVVLSEEDISAQEQLRNLVTGKLVERQRFWHYYDYDEWASNLYMAVRLPQNYASIKKVMEEIRSSDPQFEPRTVLDFGSGMGTTMWAVNETWPKAVSEFMNVDISVEQRYLCESLLRGGQEISSDPLPGVFHRQYLPSSNKVKYDMVVAAYSMLELPNAEMRAQTIENLWNKTNDLLVIIERGNQGGFAIVNEARHFILDLGGHDVTKKVTLSVESCPIYNRKIPQSHVLAPCSHEFICPRYQMPSKRNMNVCRFPISFEPLEVGMKRPPILKEEYSYVVIRKGPHPTYELGFDADHYNRGLVTRPCRIVEKPRRVASQVIHKLCCPNGSLAEVVCTKAKYGKATHEVAKASKWGDLSPIKVNDTYKTYSERNRNKDET